MTNREEKIFFLIRQAFSIGASYALHPEDFCPNTKEDLIFEIFEKFINSKKKAEKLKKVENLQFIYEKNLNDLM